MRPEKAGVITGHAARLEAGKMGVGMRAIMRVNLARHGAGRNDDFARFVEVCPQIQSAFSVSGDADCILNNRVRTLESFTDFIQPRLLPHPPVSQLRSEIVLKTLGDELKLSLT